ncbi:MAG TPA: hypothetical protein VGK73_04730 [Polyangiaceae bacterium]
MIDSLENLRRELGLGLCAIVAVVAGCRNEGGGLTLPEDPAGSSGSGGSSTLAGRGGLGGNGASGQGDAGAGRGGQSTNGGTRSGESGRAGASSAGTSGSAEGGNGGEPASAGEAGLDAAGEAGQSGAGGSTAGTSTEGGAAGEHQPGHDGGAGEGGSAGAGDDVEPACVFHTDAAPPAGEGGAAGAPGGIAVGTSAFLGPYLTTPGGFTLYLFGADRPGDCERAPVSDCTADCTLAWLPFDAGERALAAGLDDAAFGTIQRDDGSSQTTYYGWPLYTHKADTAPNTINGQGKAKTWIAAELALPNLLVMRTPVAAGGARYLADGRGHTLYSLGADAAGGGGEPPASRCEGACSDAFEPFAPDGVYGSTVIEPRDVSFFGREDGIFQVAYKGMPLYYAKSDAHPAELGGVALFGGALVAP